MMLVLALILIQAYLTSGRLTSGKSRTRLTPGSDREKNGKPKVDRVAEDLKMSKYPGP